MRGLITELSGLDRRGRTHDAAMVSALFGLASVPLPSSLPSPFLPPVFDDARRRVQPTSQPVLCCGCAFGPLLWPGRYCAAQSSIGPHPSRRGCCGSASRFFFHLARDVNGTREITGPASSRVGVARRNGIQTWQKLRLFIILLVLCRATSHNSSSRVDQKI